MVVVLTGIHLLTLPLAFVVFGRLRDRGYGFSRALGLLLLAWVAWMLPALHLLKNNLLPVLVALLALAAVATGLWRRHGAEMRAFWQAERRLLLWSEGVFNAAFLLFVFIRLLNPDTLAAVAGRREVHGIRLP